MIKLSLRNKKFEKQPGKKGKIKSLLLKKTLSF